MKKDMELTCKWEVLNNRKGAYFSTSCKEGVVNLFKIASRMNELPANILKNNCPFCGCKIVFNESL